MRRKPCAICREPCTERLPSKTSGSHDRVEPSIFLCFRIPHSHTEFSLPFTFHPVPCAVCRVPCAVRLAPNPVRLYANPATRTSHPDYFQSGCINPKSKIRNPQSITRSPSIDRLFLPYPPAMAIRMSYFFPNTDGSASAARRAAVACRRI